MEEEGVDLRRERGDWLGLKMVGSGRRGLGGSGDTQRKRYFAASWHQPRRIPASLQRKMGRLKKIPFFLFRLLFPADDFAWLRKHDEKGEKEEEREQWSEEEDGGGGGGGGNDCVEVGEGRRFRRSDLGQRGAKGL